jgi:putative SOS response-associated peptidase YedK
MCGRYAIYTEEENLEMREIIREINDRYVNDIGRMKTGEIFPTNIAPAIIAKDASGRQASLLKWGFENRYSGNGLLINARSETIFEKPTFRRLIPINRCLLPASCFFEWKADEIGHKIKYAIRPDGSSLFYMAGIFDDQGSFVIITTDANEQMSVIHNRMPVMFRSPVEAFEWISPASSGTGIIQERFAPLDRALIIKAA